MQLRGQHGYAMAALLVGMSVAAVLMTAAMPVWKQAVRREKEAELVFRGQQYARAIGLFQRRAGPGALPPSVDVLVTGRFLRKKFKDPITGQDFNLLSPSQGAGAGGAGVPVPGQTPQEPQPATQPSSGLGGVQPPGSVIAAQAGGRGAVGGIIGVASKSRESSLRIYNGRTRYNEWQFVYTQQTQAPSAPSGAPQRGGQPPFGTGSQRGQGPQGRGQPQNPASGRGAVPQGTPPPSGGGQTQPASLPPSPFQPRLR